MLDRWAEWPNRDYWRSDIGQLEPPKLVLQAQQIVVRLQECDDGLYAIPGYDLVNRTFRREDATETRLRRPKWCIREIPDTAATIAIGAVWHGVG